MTPAFELDFPDDKWTCPATGAGPVPMTLQANLEYRSRLIDKARTDVELQRGLVTVCTKSALFFLNAFAWTYRPIITPGTPERVVSTRERSAWCEIGGKQIFFSSLPRPNPLPASHTNHEVLGIVPVLNELEAYRVYRLAYTPTPTERENGFDIDIYIAEAIFAEPLSGYGLDGFTLDVETATVLGN